MFAPPLDAAGNSVSGQLAAPLPFTRPRPRSLRVTGRGSSAVVVGSVGIVCAVTPPRRRGRSHACARGGGAAEHASSDAGGRQIAIMSAARREAGSERFGRRRAGSRVVVGDRVVDRRDGGNRHGRADVARHVRDPGGLPDLVGARRTTSTPTTRARWRARARRRARAAARRTRRSPTSRRRTPARRSRPPPGANPSTTAEPRPMRTASGVISGVIAIIAAAAGSVARPAWKRAHPEPVRVLEVQAEDVHEPVDRAGDDQDRERRADEHAVAQQLQVDERCLRPPLDAHEQHGGHDRDHEATDRRGRDPAPVVALAEREDERSEHQRDQHRPGPVDRARPRPVARLLHRARCASGMQAAAIAASIQKSPCQPVVSTSTPPSSGPSAPPAADAAPHSVIAFICAVARRGDRQQAHAAGEDRGARRALDHAAADHAGCRPWRARSARTSRRRAPARRGRPSGGRARRRARRRSRSPPRRRASNP